MWKWKMSKGNKKKICENCKREFKLNSPSQKYCVKCRISAYKIKEKNSRIKNKKIIKENWKKWYQKNKKRIRYKRKREDIKEMRRKDTIIQRQRYPEKVKARNKTQKIKIPKGTKCQKCHKRSARHKHHLDYSQPHKIKFLCIECHTDIHYNKG